jgi:hypothetical protein
MKKRSLLVASLLAASVSQASKDSDYLKEKTGPGQPEINTLCLKVETLSIASMGPHGGVSQIIGLQVANASPVDLVVGTNPDTKLCATGYVKIMTTAPLWSVRNAPIGL